MSSAHQTQENWAAKNQSGFLGMLYLNMPPKVKRFNLERLEQGEKRIAATN